MMEIKGHKLSLVSFPDFAVMSWSLDTALRNFVVTTDGAFLDDSDGQTFKQARLSLTNWNSLTVRRYGAQAEEWECCNFDVDELRDICEFQFSGDALTLRGFGRKDGHWMEFRIMGGIASASFD